jgi:hypothetical protein
MKNVYSNFLGARAPHNPCFLHECRGGWVGGWSRRNNYAVDIARSLMFVYIRDFPMFLPYRLKVTDLTKKNTNTLVLRDGYLNAHFAWRRGRNLLTYYLTCTRPSGFTNANE